MTGGELIIGGGGSTAVGTATLFSHADRLDELRSELDACARSVAVIDHGGGYRLLLGSDAPLSAARAATAIDDTLAQLRGASSTSAWLAAALRTSAHAYGSAEDALTRFTQALAAEVGYAFGFVGTAAGLVILPWVLAGAAVVGSGYALAHLLDPDGTRRALHGLGRWIDDNNGILSHPAFVEFVRLAVMSSDDVVGGMLHLPPAVMNALGDQGLGITGTDTVAGGLLLAGGLAGALRETPVTVSSGSTTSTTRPVGLAGRAARVPEGRAKVRVDRYVMPDGQDRFEVYIAGTSDFSPVASDHPFDLTSDVAALAGADAGAYRAVEEALALAGAEADSPLIVTGYSQGGLIGSMLATSGEHDVQALYSLGAPAAQVPVPDTIPWVAVEHTDDIVPAVGGNWVADPLLLRREALIGGESAADELFPAHQLERYRETAVMADASDEARITEMRERMDGFSDGALRVESTLYTAHRQAVRR